MASSTRQSGCGSQELSLLVKIRAAKKPIMKELCHSSYGQCRYTVGHLACEFLALATCLFFGTGQGWHATGSGNDYITVLAQGISCVLCRQAQGNESKYVKWLLSLALELKELQAHESN